MLQDPIPGPAAAFSFPYTSWNCHTSRPSGCTPPGLFTVYYLPRLHRAVVCQKVGNALGVYKGAGLPFLQA